MAKLNATQIEALNKKLHSMINSPGGVNKFMSKVTSPLRKARDLVSGVRKVFLHDPLGQGDVSIYDTDPEAFAYVIPNQSSAPIRLVPDEYRQVQYKTFDMVVYKEFSASQVKLARYNFLKRIEQVLRNAIVQLEDELMFQVLDNVIADGDYPFTPVNIAAGTGITPTNASDMYGQIEDFVDPAYFLGKSSNFSSVRTWGVDIFAPVRREQVFKTGIIGYIWNAAVYKSRFAASNRLYCTGDPEFLGRVPEYLGLTPLEVVSPRNGKQELGMLQRIGIGAHNPRAIAAGNIA